MMIRSSLICLMALATSASGGEVPKQAEDFPQFLVPGHDAPMARLQELFRLHHGGAVTPCTLWDAWLPHSTLWAATGATPSAQPMRDRYRSIFLGRRIGDDGYVSMQQHRGLAHSEGWPFPTFQQAGGLGWYFSIADEVYGIQNFNMKALTSTEGWEIAGAEVEGIDPASGLRLSVIGDAVTLTTPPFSCDTKVAPFARLEWSSVNLPAGASPSISWQLDGETTWAADRKVAFPVPKGRPGRLHFSNVSLADRPGFEGKLTRLRLTIEGAKGASLALKSLITAIDTRHPITNTNFVRGSAEYFAWTGDLPFLRTNLGRMRGALRYALKEFQVRERKLVHVPWAGHDGRSGIVLGPDGAKTIRHGFGVGNNYWDLLPFGNDDALATIYLYDALRKMAALERQVADHPEWAIPAGAEPFDSADLNGLADEVKAQAGKTFWDDATGRFAGWKDADGKAVDYGFTFVNLEAIYYGIATDEQANRIFDWLDGRREVAGDTSRGADIYHWRFGLRSTTKRNVETYVWAWSGPEGIPWGDQVQDGGAVMGFSYFDIMARLKVLGPNAAWSRLRELLAWFGEVQDEGGYRAYYAKPGRGTLQGGGPPGGLGLDQEFLESVLVPQVMLYGFLGCEPIPGGLRLDPHLPSDWPSLEVTCVQAQGHVLDIAATPDEIRLKAVSADGSGVVLGLPKGQWEVAPLDPSGNPAGAPTLHELGGQTPTVRLAFEKDLAYRCRRVGKSAP